MFTIVGAGSEASPFLEISPSRRHGLRVGQDKGVIIANQAQAYRQLHDFLEWLDKSIDGPILDLFIIQWVDFENLIRSGDQDSIGVR